MTSLEEIAEVLRDLLSSLDDEIMTAATERRLAAKPPTGPRPKPHDIVSVSAPLHLIQFEDGMWEATSPIMPKLRVQSADKAKLVEALVPDEIARLAAQDPSDKPS